MRAIEPRISDYVNNDGVRVHFEVYGEADPTVFLLTPDTIVESRAWKGQIPFLARHFQVIVIDPRGNGLSEVALKPEGMALSAMIADAWSVLDKVGVERAVLVGLCTGGAQAALMAAERPERALGVFAINPGLVLAPIAPPKAHFAPLFDDELDTDEGWAKLNRHYWLRDWTGFAQFFFEQMFPEPHSTKQIEDCVGWAAMTTAEVMLFGAELGPDPRVLADGARQVIEQIRCPVFVVTGSEDRCQNPDRGRVFADLTGGQHVEIVGGGHLPNARDPVKVNLLIRDFVRRMAG